MAVLNQYVDLNLNKSQILNPVLHTSATDIGTPVEGQIYYNSANKKAFLWNGTLWIDLSQVVAGAITLKGTIANASTNPVFPAAPIAGDTYFVTTTAGTVGGIAVDIGDQLVYSGTSWFVFQTNVVAATETIPGYIALATLAETLTGTNDTKAVTPLKLKSLGYTRKFTVDIATLTANTGAIVSHNFALTNMADFIGEAYQGGDRIIVSITPTTVNSATVTSHVTLAAVRIVIIG